LEHSGEQWDDPNAWPPIQYIMIMGLDNTNDVGAKELTFLKWQRNGYIQTTKDSMRLELCTKR